MLVAQFSISANAFAVALPAGITAMTGASSFYSCYNSFSGALPERGMAAMSTMTALDVGHNSFTGTLPDGTRAM
eukprot:3166828-Amphidinium_carterae.1